MNPRTVVLLLLPLLTIRFAWGAWPSIWLCAAFWCSAVLLTAAWASALRMRAISPQGMILVGVGAALNGVVMLVNGGFMPVVGKPAGFQYGIWASAEDHNRMLYLADRMAMAGGSPGDILIAIGVVISLILGIASWRQKRAQANHSTSTQAA